MSADHPGKQPLVSGDIFNRLQEDLEDTEIARRYLLDYLQMWEDRYVRLSAAVDAGNIEAAMDAVLSVRTSARMIGALRLTILATRIEQYLAAGNTQGAALLLNELEVCGRLTMEELRRRFLPRSGTEGADSQRQDQQNPASGREANGWLRRVDNLLAGLAIFARCEPTLD